MIYAFIYGAILSFGLIIPLGVQNVFIFNQGASQRHFLHALPSVAAASICDILLISMAILGVSVAVLHIAWLKTTIFMIGFFFLLYMGWVTWRNNPTKLQNNSEPLSPKKQVGFAISFSLLNPHALLDSIGVIGASSLNFTGSEKWMFTIACFIISCCWFFSLSVAGHTLQRLDKSGKWLLMINKISALIIWTVALYIGWQLVKEYYVN